MINLPSLSKAQYSYSFSKAIIAVMMTYVEDIQNSQHKFNPLHDCMGVELIQK